MEKVYNDTQAILNQYKSTPATTLALVALALFRMPPYDYNEIFLATQQR